MKTDNCATQYCCLWVFKRYSNLAQKIGKPIILYYGVNGHGSGLVDAMSGFGVKSPLRRKIITDDFYLENANELEVFLKGEFEDDDRKMYTSIKHEDLVEIRKYREACRLTDVEKQD